MSEKGENREASVRKPLLDGVVLGRESKTISTLTVWTRRRLREVYHGSSLKGGEDLGHHASWRPQPQGFPDLRTHCL